MSQAEIGILGTEKGPHIRELRDTFEALGHPVVLLNPKRLTARLPEGSISFADSQGRQTRLEDLRGLVVRSIPGGSLEEVTYRLNTLHYLEKLGVRVLNSAAVIEKTVDKFYSTALLARAGLPVPRTVVAESFDAAMTAVEEMGRVVVKPVFGSLGKGIVRVDDPDTAYRVFRALELGRYVYYVQEYLESGGEDFRLMVTGDRVLGAMRRRGQGCQSWKSNIACGATAEHYHPNPELADLALRATQALGSDYAGVDILISAGKPYVLEANGIPGWTGLQTVSNFSVAGALAEFFLQRIYDDEQ